MVYPLTFVIFFKTPNWLHIFFKKRILYNYDNYLFTQAWFLDEFFNTDKRVILKNYV